MGNNDQLNSIPTVGGSSLPLLSFLGGFNFLLNSKRLLQEGYRKVNTSSTGLGIDSYVTPVTRLQYYGSVFKVPLPEQWILIVSGPKMVEELRKRPDDELSFSAGVEDVR